MSDKHAPSSNDPHITVHRVGVGGYLHQLVPIVDSSGVVVQRVLRPFMVELRARDVVQILVGATILAIPLAFTQETWDLGRTLPVANVALLSGLSILFIALFVHYHFYKDHLREYTFHYLKRVMAIYVVSLLVVGVLMTVIQQCPWATDWVLAVKRVVIVALPASLSATIADALK